WGNGSATSKAGPIARCACPQSSTVTPPGLSIYTRMTDRAPCPTHTTSTNSKPNAQRMGDTTSLMRSTTDRDSFTDTLSPVSFDGVLKRSNKKVGLRPLPVREHSTPPIPKQEGLIDLT